MVVLENVSPLSYSKDNKNMWSAKIGYKDGNLWDAIFYSNRQQTSLNWGEITGFLHILSDPRQISVVPREPFHKILISWSWADLIYTNLPNDLSLSLYTLSLTDWVQEFFENSGGIISGTFPNFTPNSDTPQKDQLWKWDSGIKKWVLDKEKDTLINIGFTNSNPNPVIKTKGSWAIGDKIFITGFTTEIREIISISGDVLEYSGSKISTITEVFKLNKIGLKDSWYLQTLLDTDPRINPLWKAGTLLKPYNEFLEPLKGTQITISENSWVWDSKWIKQNYILLDDWVIQIDNSFLIEHSIKSIKDWDGWTELNNLLNTIIPLYQEIGPSVQNPQPGVLIKPQEETRVAIIQTLLES
jgi:hypothetical protein